MVGPLNAYAAGNLFASGDRSSGASAVKSLFETSTAAPTGDPYGLLAGAQAQTNALNTQLGAEQALRGPDGGLGRVSTLLGELRNFVSQGTGELDADGRAELQTKIDNLLSDTQTILSNTALTDPALIADSGFSDLAVSVLSREDAGRALDSIADVTSRIADNAGDLSSNSELSQAQSQVFAALTGVSGLSPSAYDSSGGALNQQTAQSLLSGSSALALFA